MTCTDSPTSAASSLTIALPFHLADNHAFMPSSEPIIGLFFHVFRSVIASLHKGASVRRIIRQMDGQSDRWMVRPLPVFF